MSEKHFVAKVADLPPGRGTTVKVGGKTIAVFNAGGEYFALDDYCTHKGAPLSTGYLSGKTITCEWHAATFDLETGKALTAPAFGGVDTYKVVVDGDSLYIEA